MLTTDDVCALDKFPGSTTNECNDETASEASAASVSAELELALKKVSACALTESRAAVFELEAAYKDDNDPATLETSLFCPSASPAKLADAL
jgi:hypothetical protein